VWIDPALEDRARLRFDDVRRINIEVKTEEKDAVDPLELVA